ncbi:hypothetical protein VFPFJ_03943 [Purpureocillium lilacinum]|uniref:Uncharacterized protein n=1 Tax=Purpureocillium lilacinum TaxID=33203 RepID=A0A179HS64_PURLI|nr:hypothetical protein VFPFJ_03943 [Purpureocillium lilacinum]OAQ92203.1 hypothetical protein VFPFJ_03943 [Purpureocillium lilacinum]
MSMAYFAASGDRPEQCTEWSFRRCSTRRHLANNVQSRRARPAPSRTTKQGIIVGQALHFWSSIKG